MRQHNIIAASRISVYKYEKRTRLQMMQNQTPQLPLGWPFTQTQALPLQWWLKYPQKFHPPAFVLPQSHSDHVFRGNSFMKGMQYPEEKVAKVDLYPKQPLQILSPTAQLRMSAPLTGRVVVRTPPVQPSQQPPSMTAKGVYWTWIGQKGLEIFLGEVMQRSGSALVQGWSPSKGLQLLQENLPTQLDQQEGQTVACIVRPLLIGWTLVGIAAVLSEVPACPLAMLTKRSAARANCSAVIFIISIKTGFEKITAAVKLKKKSFASGPSLSVSS